MKNSSNILIIAVIVIVLGVAGYFIFKPKEKPDTTTTDKDKDKPPVIDDGNDFYKNPPVTPPPVTPPVTPPAPPILTPAKCGYMKYKRGDDVPPFKLLDENELWKNPDSFVNRMRADGHSYDYMSYAAAFLKGMDMALKTDIARQYSKEIMHFKSRAEITRNDNFREEIQNQKYDVGSLICESPNILMRLGLVNRNIFK